MVLPQRIETDLDAPLATPSAKCLYCSLPARKQCSKCVDVYFCDEKHQKLAWGTHKYRCGHSSSTFIQPEWLRWESDLFAESSRVDKLLEALKADFPRDLPLLLPEILLTRVRTAKPSEKLLIDVLRGMCAPSVKPLDYFWDMCCSQFKDKLSVDKGTEWRIAIRHIFRWVTIIDQNTIEVIYTHSGFYGYFLACQTRLFLRESSFPLSLQNQLLDAYVYFYQISIASILNETEAEARNIGYRAYGNYVEMVRVLYQHEFKNEMDRLAVSRAMVDAETMWTPVGRWTFNDGSDERRLSDLAAWPAKLRAKRITTE